tara:strand:+ start:285 stop:641 length:357 start_codon:yes stop_codon:yes gene_type:complete
LAVLWLLAPEIRGIIKYRIRLYRRIDLSEIPKVSREVTNVIKHELDRQAVDKASLAYLVEFWAQFRIEQPELAALLVEEIKGAKGTKEKGFIAHGAWLVYKSFKVQSEADQMNKQWGD